MPSPIQIHISPDLTMCPPGLAVPVPGDDIVILPSSLNRRDRAAANVRNWLRSQEVTSHLLIPEPMLAATFGRRTAWSEVEIATADGDHFPTIGVPAALARALQVWTVTDIDAVAGRGPYILDLPIRYANPATRLRGLGSRRRASIAVALLQALPLSNHLIVRRFPAFTLLATTSDPIAAELLSLSFVDEQLPPDSQVTGPWEDEFVQRATELELGACVPSDITIKVNGPRHEAILDLLSRIVARMGVQFEQVTFPNEEGDKSTQ